MNEADKCVIHEDGPFACRMTFLQCSEKKGDGSPFPAADINQHEHEHICKRHKFRNNLQVNANVFLEIRFLELEDYCLSEQLPEVPVNCNGQHFSSQFTVPGDFPKSSFQPTSPALFRC